MPSPTRTQGEDREGQRAGDARERQEFLSALLFAAEPHLADPQVYAVRRDEVRGQIASASQSIDEPVMKSRVVQRQTDSVLTRVARSGRMYIGSVPAMDPARSFFDEELLHAAGLAVVPIRAGHRPACLLVGYPADPDQTHTRDALEVLANAASEQLSALVGVKEPVVIESKTPILPDELAVVRHVSTQQELMEALLGLMPARIEDGAVLLLRDGTLIEKASSSGLSKASIAEHEPSLAWEAVRSEAMVVRRIGSEDPLIARVLGREEEARDVAVVPVCVRGRPLLLLCGASWRPLTEDDRLRFSMLASEASSVLARLVAKRRASPPRQLSRNRVIAGLGFLLILAIAIVLLGKQLPQAAGALKEFARDLASTRP